MNEGKNPIGVFDSGYGGLAILKSLRAHMPNQDFLYLGDHRHAPYGARPKKDVLELTTTSVAWLFQHKCKLVILACNTASSILRDIQKDWLPKHYPRNRVLGVVAPTVEMVTGVNWDFSTRMEKSSPTVTVGVFATKATVKSQVYPLEIHKRAPHINVVQQACPSLTSLIEKGAPKQVIETAVRGYVDKLRTQLGSYRADYILLGCTHYALITNVFRTALGKDVRLIDQPDCVAKSLKNYLKRHSHFRSKATETCIPLFTTGDANLINTNGHSFLGKHETFLQVKDAFPE